MRAAQIDRPAHHFDDLEQQHESAVFGMWIFLVTEVMFFGGLFAGYAVYRGLYPASFAEGSEHLDLVLGSVNTGVLITSSLTMALAIRGAQHASRPMQVVCLVLTALLGLAFLGIKAVEYHHEIYSEATHTAEHVRLFITFYFLLTGTHALHMIIGIGLILVMAVWAWRGRFTPRSHAALEASGLYWHFVDCVWIFLFPLLYLVGP